LQPRISRASGTVVGIQEVCLVFSPVKEISEVTRPSNQ
jgi:hypothetical protein